jgi:putative membrane protein
VTRPAASSRFPRWVYGVGDEPDPRFSLANERTFLAWIRTALALLAAGVALEAVPLEIAGWLQASLAGLFIVLGVACAVAAWMRWARAERALRNDEPLPASHFALVLAVVVVLAGMGLIAAGLARA